MDIRCKCGMPVTFGVSGAEMFCINPLCSNFMRDVQTGVKVDDPRYDVMSLPDSDPRKVERIRQLLDSRDYMKQIAAIRILDCMKCPGAIEILNQYLIAGKIENSVLHMAMTSLMNKKDVKSLPGLQAGLRLLETNLSELKQTSTNAISCDGSDPIQDDTDIFDFSDLIQDEIELMHRVRAAIDQFDEGGSSRAGSSHVSCGGIGSRLWKRLKSLVR